MGDRYKHMSVTLLVSLASRLRGERATDSSTVHWHGWWQAAQAPCLLPGPSYHREDGVHPKSRGHAQQHQSPGNPIAARKQHEGYVSTLHRFPCAKDIEIAGWFCQVLVDSAYSTSSTKLFLMLWLWMAGKTSEANITSCWWPKLICSPFFKQCLSSCA